MDSPKQMVFQASQYTISVMSLAQAKQIVTWQYEAPYSRYNMENQPEDIEELLDGTYYAVTNSDKELIGFFCYGKNAQVRSGAELGLYDDHDALDIGLGLRPDLTGQGHGTEFLKAGMMFANNAFGTSRLRLSVAEFNSRAIKLYEKLGFVSKAQFIHKHLDQATGFILMETAQLDNINN